MKTLRIIGMGLSGLLANWGRTALTMLGIIIGVAAVVMLTSIGNGVQQSVAGQINNLGPNLITISPGSEGGGGGPFGSAPASTLTPEDAETVADLPGVQAASPSVSVAARTPEETVSLTGVGSSYAGIRSVDLSAGRFLNGRGEIVLSASAARNLLDAAPEEAVGQTVNLGGREYEVAGVSEREDPGFGPPVPETSYIATADALEISGQGNVGLIVAQARNADSVDRAVSGIKESLTAAHGGAEDFSVTTQQELLSAFTDITDQLQVFLIGIAGISLLVGGIGVMNIMLVSVSERTREIGVRKAVGATDLDVLLQFLFEAVLLSLIGGLLGIAAGIGGATLLPELLADLPQAVFTGPEIALAFGVAALIGVVFGVLPAYRSARLAPVEALRRE